MYKPKMPPTPTPTPTLTPMQTQTKNKKFWNFKNVVNAVDNSESTELRISGDIIDSEDAWIYEWFGIPVASPNAFRNELAQYADKDITVWIDSNGGSAFAGIGLYNALMEHKKSGAKVTTIGDSKVMSAATFPFMAGDERLMSIGGMFMTHNPLPGNGVYGYASDLRNYADILDEVKENLVNIYEMGTGLSREAISTFMNNESYMSANTAVKEGFATGIYQPEANTQTKVSNFSFSRFAVMNTATSSMKSFYEALGNNKELTEKIQNRPTIPGTPVVDTSPKTKSKEEIKMPDITNVSDLKTQLPAIHDEIINSGNAAGVAAERARLKAFDVLNGKVDPDFLNSSKYEDGATAESVLFKAMQEGKMINSAYVAQAEADAANANKVPGASSDNTNPDEVTGVLNKVASVVSKVLGPQEGGRK
jgi:ATP-dependent protease ClpP protease subunit